MVVMQLSDSEVRVALAALAAQSERFAALRAVKRDKGAPPDLVERIDLLHRRIESAVWADDLRQELEEEVSDD